MALPIQKFREIVLQVLYSLDFSEINESSLVEMIMNQFKISKKNAQKCIEKSLKIFEKKTETDAMITQACDSYKLDRISKVEKNILRLCLFEILFDPSIPEKVSIAEGIRLAKKFGSFQSISFVNGVLDNIYKKELSCQSKLV